MAADYSQTDLSALGARVDAVQRQVDALTGALQQGKRVRRLLLLGVVVFIGGFLYLFYKAATDFQSEENMAKLTELLQARAQAKTEDVLSELKTLAENAGPPVRTAFLEQIKKDSPAFLDAVQKERDPLVTNVQRELTARLQAHHRDILTKHEQIFRTEFKNEIKDEAAFALMMDNFKSAADAMVRDYYAAAFEREMKRLYKLWDDFPAVRSDKSNDELADELIGHVMEILKLKVIEADKTSKRA